MDLRTDRDGRPLDANGDLHDASLGTLVREFMQEGRDLVRAELKLARAELRAEAKKATAGGGMVAAGAVVGLLGAMALTGFLILALAEVMPAWAAALLVAVALLVVAAAVTMAGVKRFKRVRGPTRTLQTLKEDGEWASRTLQSVKSPAHGHA